MGKLEEIARATSDRLRSDIRDGLTVKADLETQIYKVKRRQQEQEEENARLRTYLAKTKQDLDRALRWGVGLACLDAYMLGKAWLAAKPEEWPLVLSRGRC